jgi:uncharacterized protein YbjT (DUF2867 family)
VRVLARDPERAGEQLGRACERVRGDVEDRESLAKALEGCTALNLSLNSAGVRDSI